MDEKVNVAFVWSLIAAWVFGKFGRKNKDRLNTSTHFFLHFCGSQKEVASCSGYRWGSPIPDGHLKCSIDDFCCTHFSLCCRRSLDVYTTPYWVEAPDSIPQVIRRQTSRPAPRPAIQLSRSVHTLTEQLTYLKCVHTYTEYSYQSGYIAQNITHAKQPGALPQSQISMPLSVVVNFQKKKRNYY